MSVEKISSLAFSRSLGCSGVAGMVLILVAVQRRHVRKINSWCPPQLDAAAFEHATKQFFIHPLRHHVHLAVGLAH